MQCWRRTATYTLAEIQSGLAAKRRQRWDDGTRGGFFDRTGSRVKKVRARAKSSKAGPNVLRQRQSWFDGQLDLDPEPPRVHPDENVDRIRT